MRGESLRNPPSLPLDKQAGKGSAKPRRCLFCGGHPLTVEHALPKWLLRALDSAAGNQPPGITQAWFGAEETPRSWDGPEIKVKYFCGPCNSGWMSRLESEAKPLITPLLADLSVSLDSSAQRVLARWSMKTAIVLEGSGPKDRLSLYTPSDLQLVANSASPALPNDTVVWIGRHSQSKATFGAGRQLFQVVPLGHAPSPIEEGYVTTLGLGRLVLQVLRLKLRQEDIVKTIKLAIKRGPWTRSLVQIWPRRNAVVQWPPHASFSESGTTLDQLSERFRGM